MLTERKRAGKWKERRPQCPREGFSEERERGKIKLMKTKSEEKKWKKLQVSESDRSRVGMTDHSRILGKESRPQE